MAQQSSADATDTPVDEATEIEAPKKSGAIIKVVLFVVALAIGGSVGFTSYERVATIQHRPGNDSEEAPVEYGEFFEITGIIVNPSESAGKRYLMVNIGLEGSEDTIADIEAKQIVIRDMIIKTLGQKTIDRLSDITRRDSMKSQLLTNVNGIIREGVVDRLYFTQYVIQ